MIFFPNIQKAPGKILNKINDMSAALSKTPNVNKNIYTTFHNTQTRIKNGGMLFEPGLTLERFK